MTSKVETEICPFPLVHKVRIMITNHRISSQPETSCPELNIGSLSRETVEQLCDQFKQQMLELHDQTKVSFAYGAMNPALLPEQADRP